MNRALEFYKNHLKQLPLMASVLATLNVNVPPSRHVRNPTYADRNASVYVYPNSVHDFGNGESLDNLGVLTGWGQMPMDEAITLLARFAGLDAPVNAEPRVKPVQAKPLPDVERIDPGVFGSFAQQAANALEAGSSQTAQRALEYLAGRGLEFAPVACGVGVVDASIRAAFPRSSWAGLIVFPTWQDQKLQALKARNAVTDAAKRVYQNLTGASVPLYNLERALQASEKYTLIVEGEIDCLSVLEATNLEMPVVGLAGTNNWKKSLTGVDFGNRHLMIALDDDDAGTKATAQILTWARENGITTHAVDCGGYDKNELLVGMGREALRDHLTDCMWTATERSRAQIRRSLL
jgi:DNA primase